MPKFKPNKGFKMESPLKRTDPPTTEEWVQADEEYAKAKSGSRKNLAERLSKRYGTEITKKKGVWSDPKGVSVAELEKNILSSGEFTYSGE
jgi:hypothetical protein